LLFGELDQDRQFELFSVRQGYTEQKQKRFLRRSQGEDSRKPVAIHANQAIKEQER
jgi:hypothetical protein